MTFNLKYISLICLIIQNATLILTMRYTTTRKDHFYTSTAVVMSETLKLVTCLLIVLYEFQGNIAACSRHLYSSIILQPVDTLRVMVPGVVYMIQNNLLFVAVSNLPAATFQVTYQLKILTTAMFSVALLGRSLSKLQWFSMVLLFSGVAIVQVEVQYGQQKEKSSVEQHAISGLLAVIVSCISSGFAGVYFEKILKGSQASLWLRNIQLGLFGAVTSLIGVFLKDGSKIMENGFFHGYTYLVWAVIFIQAFGGLLVAVVIKYADNILKGFATSVSIVVSTVLAMFLFDFHITMMFLFGAALVISAVYFYNSPKKVDSPLLPTQK